MGVVIWKRASCCQSVVWHIYLVFAGLIQSECIFLGKRLKLRLKSFCFAHNIEHTFLTYMVNIHRKNFKAAKMIWKLGISFMVYIRRKMFKPWTKWSWPFVYPKMEERKCYEIFIKKNECKGDFIYEC